MTALQITSMKQFMNHLLVAETFDPFLLEEAVIRTASTFTIDGRLNREFYAGEDSSQENVSASCCYDFRPFSELKKLCFDLMKGRRTPLSFQFVLHLKPEKAAALLENENCGVDLSQLKALVLSIRYDGAKTVLTSGTSFHTFIPSREPDMIWDKALKQYLQGKNISYEPL